MKSGSFASRLVVGLLAAFLSFGSQVAVAQETPAQVAARVAAAPNAAAKKSIIDAAVRANPANASAIVTAAIAANPSSAADITSAAVAAAPTQASAITTAAVTAAPTQAAAITTAAVTAAPTQAAAITTAAVTAAPTQAAAITTAAVTAAPDQATAITTAAVTAAPTQVDAISDAAVAAVLRCTDCNCESETHCQHSSFGDTWELQMETQDSSTVVFTIHRVDKDEGWGYDGLSIEYTVCESSPAQTGDDGSRRLQDWSRRRPSRAAGWT